MASGWFGGAGRRRGALFVLFILILCARAGDVHAQCTPASPCISGPTILGTLGGTLSNSRGISDDGSAIAGVSFVAGNLRHAYRWEAGTMVDLGTLGGSESVTTALSGDGSAVVGWSYVSGNAALHAFRWQNGSMEDLGTLGGTNSDATGVSIDGSVVVGTSDVASGYYHAFRWEGGSMADLGTLGGNRSIATDVSGDGKVVVGSSDTASSGSHAYRWEGGQMLDLGTLGGSESDATAVSRDGSTVIGESQTTGNAAYHAFLWKGGSLVDLGTLGGTQSYAIAVNGDGSVVVGRSLLGDNATLQAYRWEGGAMVDLGSLGGARSEAHSLNRDGSVVGGSATDGAGLTQAFRWAAESGMQNLNALLANAGVDMTGIRLIGVPHMTPDGTFMSGVATYAGQTRAYIVRYDDGIGGLTTTESQQSSVNALADDRTGMMAQQHGLANPLLGGDKPLTNDSEVGVFGMGGSAAGGGYARFANGGGLAVLAGVSYGEEAYQDASIEDSLMGALALRYLDPGKALWRPMVEVGGWLAPEADMAFQRTYMNGAGTTTGVGSTHGDVSYLYARAGVVFDLGKREQIAVSGEIGRERLEVDGYSETLAGNPFNAVISAGTDRMDLAKARLAWSFGIAPRMDATLWGAGVYGFNRESDLVVGVVGLGGFAPVIEDETAWAEYGARVGYAVTETVTLDVFVNGVSGEEDIGTRVHGGGGLRYRF